MTSPVFTAIEAHWAAADELRALDILAEREVFEQSAMDDKNCEAGDRESAAFLAVLTAVPTTKDEAIALLISILGAILRVFG